MKQAKIFIVENKVQREFYNEVADSVRIKRRMINELFAEKLNLNGTKGFK